MWPESDRRLGETIKALERERELEKKMKLKEQAEDHFKKTLDKIWPLTSNEKPS
jgi:hypothetical protein